MSLAEIENKGLDKNLFDYLCKRWELTPINQALDISLTYLGLGSAGLKMCAGQEFTTVHGRLHGGISATLADSAMGWAILTLGRTCVTVDMYMNYYAPSYWENELRAEARVIYSGKRTVAAEAALFNDKGELVAQSRGTFSLKKGNLQAFESDS